jgi:asparaginyl-tRNA synthetase
MKHIDIYKIFEQSELLNTEVTVCGWVRTSRDSKNMAFIELNDGTTFKHLQIVIDKAQMPEVADFMKLGSSLKVCGTLVKSAVAVDSVEINANEITLRVQIKIFSNRRLVRQHRCAT